MADFHIKQNDTSPAIQAQLEDQSGDPVDISGYNEVSFHMKLPGASSAKVDTDTGSGVSVTDAPTGQVEYSWSSGDTDTAERYRAEFEVEYSDGSIESFPNSDYIEIRILEELS